MDEAIKAGALAGAILGQSPREANCARRGGRDAVARSGWQSFAGMKRPAGVRVVTDQAERARQLEAMLQDTEGLRVLECRAVDAQSSALVNVLLGLPESAAAVLVDCTLPSGELARVARRYRSSKRRCPLVFMVSEKNSEALDAMLQGGARAVIPRAFGVEALIAALRVVVSGERFRPYVMARPVRAVRVQSPDRTLPAHRAFDAQADKPLSPAEMDVCRLVAQHLSDREIAQLRGTGRGTVRTQVTNLMRKLGCKRRDEAGEIYRRLYEIDDDAVQSALRGESVNLDWLLEFMDVERMRKGTVLFRRGQTARKLYYLEEGEVKLHEIASVMRPGVLFGEIGIFAPDHKRTFTAECVTDVRLRSLEAARVWRYYQLKPQFAVQVLSLITRRLMADIDRLRG